jgi:hypothetical protein
MSSKFLKNYDLKFEIFCVLIFGVLYYYIHPLLHFLYLHSPLQYTTVLARVQILNSTQFLPLFKIYSYEYIRLGFGNVELLPQHNCILYC